MTEIDTDKLRALDAEATTGELTGCGRYIGERYDAFIEDVNFSTADYNRAADGRLVQYLWNNRAAILAMAEDNKRLREALERIALSGDGEDVFERSTLYGTFQAIARRALGKDKA